MDYIDPISHLFDFAGSFGASKEIFIGSSGGPVR